MDRYFYPEVDYSHFDEDYIVPSEEKVIYPEITCSEFLKDMFPKINNICAFIDVGCHLDLKKIYFNVRNAEYSPQMMNCVFLHIYEPRSTVKIFKNGKIVSFGTNCVSDSITVMKTVVRILQRLDFGNVSYGGFKVFNVVGSSDVYFPVHLEDLALEYPQFCTFEPEIFPGLFFRTEEPKVCMTVFVNGKITFAGGKSEQELRMAFLKIYPILVEFCKEDHKERVFDRESSDSFRIQDEMIKIHPGEKKRKRVQKKEKKVSKKMNCEICDGPMGRFLLCQKCEKKVCFKCHGLKGHSISKNREKYVCNLRSCGHEVD
jgi:transcription initiation factor TFIID TATA-box-binding protein